MNRQVLLIGAGAMALAHAQVLKALGAAPTVIGRGEATASAFSAAAGLPVRRGGLAAWLGMGAAPAQAAVIAVDIEETAAAAIALMDHGVRHLLVEKPGGVDASEIALLAQRSAQTGSQVFLAYNRRFFASVQRARSLIVEDGGVTSFSFEFTELADRIAATAHSERVKANWFLANSTHVVDLAFFLGGAPESLAGVADGSLPWHKPARFAGFGRSDSGALFHYGADWTSAGRWGVELNTLKRRLILRPLETLQIQMSGKLAIDTVTVDDAEDKRFKPGLLSQMKAFLDGEFTDLVDIAVQHSLTQGAYTAILRGGTWNSRSQ